MKAKLFLVVRIFFGAYLLFFGFDHFFNYIPFADMAPKANDFFANLRSTDTMLLVGAVEVLAGLAFILNRYGPLMAVILMSISVNAVLFHITLNPSKVAGALVLLILNVVMLYAYRRHYESLIKS